MSAKTSKRKIFKLRFYKVNELPRKYMRIPYGIFLALFIVLPIFIILFYAFTYSNAAGEIAGFSFQPLVNFFTSKSKLNVLVVSLFVALATTVICLLISYPLAYFLADKKVNKNAVLITLFIAPMWINFVLRTGATRDLLYWMNIKGSQVPYVATVIGMVQNYLPFTILPLYTTMLKLDKSQMEAALDLGARPSQVFTKNIFQQTIPGLISACTMTFMPTMSSYVISDVMSEGKITLFGSYIELEFSNNAWHDGSFMSLIMLVLIGITMIFTKEKNGQQERVGVL